jgi:hypothetical protein
MELLGLGILVLLILGAVACIAGLKLTAAH